jgi:hypothetical protein
VALRLQEIVGSENCVVVGAIAVSAHGYVRATDDVDLLARLPLAEVRTTLSRSGIATTLTKGDILEGDFPCLRGELEGIRFDVLPPLAAIEWDHALHEDLLDAAMLILTHPEQRERALELAEAYQVRKQLESFLSAPRVLQSHRELNERQGPTPRRARSERSRPRRRRRVRGR